MQYMATVDGQQVPVGFRIDSATADFLKIGWSVEGYGEGAWIMNKKSIESANTSSGENPQPGVELVLPDNQAMLVLSRQQWNDLQKDKKFVHNGTSYTQVAPSAQTDLKLSEKVVDAFYVESENKTSKIWVLNNASLPIMLRIVGNPNGPDLDILSIN